MINTNRQTTTKDSAVGLGKQRSYNEVVEFLDNAWSNIQIDKTLERVKKLDTALGSPSKKTNAIFVAGSNGKSLTINFITQLLKEEGISVGSFYAPHVLTYNERISLNNESISNKLFTEIANEVINTAESLDIDVHALEVLTLMALTYFAKNNIEVAVLEVAENAAWDPVNICNPKVAAVTRITSDSYTENTEEFLSEIKKITGIAQKDTWIVSADQSKLNLQAMEQEVVNRGGKWAMPIRKLALLSYPFEQLHGRCAALAERAAQLYLEEFTTADETVIAKSLLLKPKGQRGRPTLEAKRQAELNPRRTIEQFWKESISTLPARFQLLDKEKPSILLDNASNIDAISNLLLGIRLLHYQRPLKGLVLIIGCENGDMHNAEFLKQVRYFFKKTSGQIIFCPIQTNNYSKEGSAWDVEKITNDVKNVKVKAKSAKNFADAFETAKKAVDERHGLVVVTGSSSIITEYWEYKGIKKF